MWTGTSMSLKTCSIAACTGVWLADFPVPIAVLLLGTAVVCVPCSGLKLTPCACCALCRYQELLGALHNPAAAPALQARYPIQATAVQLNDFVHTASSSLPCLLLVSLEPLLSLHQWLPCCCTAVQWMCLCWPCALVDAPCCPLPGAVQTVQADIAAGRYVPGAMPQPAAPAAQPRRNLLASPGRVAPPRPPPEVPAAAVQQPPGAAAAAAAVAAAAAAAAAAAEEYDFPSMDEGYVSAAEQPAAEQPAAEQ